MYLTKNHYRLREKEWRSVRYGNVYGDIGCPLGHAGSRVTRLRNQRNPPCGSVYFGIPRRLGGKSDR